jgi:hypothetical protein
MLNSLEIFGMMVAVVVGYFILAIIISIFQLELPPEDYDCDLGLVDPEDYE